MSDWLPILKMCVPFLVLFGTAEGLYHFGKVSAEITRKLVHVGTGLLTLFFPVVFDHLWQVVIICTTFLILLLLSMHYRFLPSINAVQRKTWGSILFPAIVILLFAFFKSMEQISAWNGLVFFWLPLLIMAIADPIAAFAGNFYKRKKRITIGKTIIGTLAFFIIAFFISAYLMYDFTMIPVDKVFLYSGAMALVTAVAERFGSRGWDNFTIPITAAGLLYLIA